MSMKQHLEQLAMCEAACARSLPSELNYCGVTDFVVDRGVPQPESAALTEEQYDYLIRVATATTLPFESKQCFHNAMMLTVLDSQMEGRIEYVEGYCFSGMIPVHHAWIELDGKLVDLTRSLRPEAVQEFFDGIAPQADLRDRVLGVIPEGWEYLGVKVESDEIATYVWEHEETNSIITNHHDGLPMFKMERITPRDFGAWDKLMSKVPAAATAD